MSSQERKHFEVKTSEHTIQSEPNVKLSTTVWMPQAPAPGPESEAANSSLPAVVFVHQYGKMGGSGELMAGMGQRLAGRGYLCATFDLRGVGRSTGSCTFRGHDEVRDVVAVCEWLAERLLPTLRLQDDNVTSSMASGSANDYDDNGNLNSEREHSAGDAATRDRDGTTSSDSQRDGANVDMQAQQSDSLEGNTSSSLKKENLSSRILLVGSSAGAPIAGETECVKLHRTTYFSDDDVHYDRDGGNTMKDVNHELECSAVDKCSSVIGYVGIGYTFGMFASVLFGRHFDAILSSKKPKFFISGTKDGFTGKSTYDATFEKCARPLRTYFFDGLGHFELESPQHDGKIVELVDEFVRNDIL